MRCPKCGVEGKIMETEGNIRTWVCADCIGFWEEDLDELP